MQAMAAHIAESRALDRVRFMAARKQVEMILRNGGRALRNSLSNAIGWIFRVLDNRRSSALMLVGFLCGDRLP